VSGEPSVAGAFVEFVIIALAVLTAAVIQETVIERVRERRGRTPAAGQSTSESP